MERNQLAVDPDAAAVRRAHANHYLGLALEMEPLLRGATQVSALERLEGGSEAGRIASESGAIEIGVIFARARQAQLQEPADRRGEDRDEMPARAGKLGATRGRRLRSCR